MRRVLTPELMDDPAVPPEELDQSLRYIRGVNRWMGGSGALLRHLNEWSRNWPKDRPITLLDIATGSADIPVAARRWARERGIDLRITAVDLHERTLDAARRHVGGEDGITLIRADALRLTDLFQPGSFDYVHTSLFLHHLSEIQVLTVLRIMDRLAARGIVWNDLIRSRRSLLVLRLLLLGQPRIVRHDATVSVRAAFTRKDVLEFAERVGLWYAKFRGVMFYRFTLAGEKPRPLADAV